MKSEAIEKRVSAFQKREKTLGSEYANRHKRGSFTDSRYDKVTSKEERRQKALDAKEPDSRPLHILTHKGVPIKDVKRYGPVVGNEEDSGMVDSGVVDDIHFAGGLLMSQNGEDNKPLSFKEKMQDLIHRSKQTKAERQLHQEEIHNLVDRLDEGWQSTLHKLAEVGTTTSRTQQRMHKTANIRQSLAQMNAVVNELQTARVPSSGGITSSDKGDDETSRRRGLDRLCRFLDEKQTFEDEEQVKEKEEEEEESGPPAKRLKPTDEVKRDIQLTDKEDEPRKRKAQPFLEVLHCMRVLIDINEEKRVQTISALCQNLKAPINRFGRMVGALLIANLLGQATTLRDRYSPELHRFLSTALTVATQTEKRCYAFIMPAPSTVSFLEITVDQPEVKDFVADEQLAVSALESFMSAGGGGNVDQKLRLHAVSLLLHLVNRESTAASNRSRTAPEVLGPLLERVKRLSIECYPSSLKDHANAVLKHLDETVNREAVRTTLQWTEPQHKEIEMVEPIFGEELSIRKRASKGQKRTPLTPAERTRQLQQRVKKEKKSAMRELRHDSEFLRSMKRKEQTKKDEDRKKKTARILGDLAMQEGEFRKLSRR